MSANLPLAIPMTVSRHIADRAEVAFKTELRSVTYAFGAEYATEWLEHELALATYRVAMRRLGEAPQAFSGPTPTAGAPEPETSACPPSRAVVTGPNGEGEDWTEEHEVLPIAADGSGPVVNGEKGK
jgi:hypothetical protein